MAYPEIGKAGELACEGGFRRDHLGLARDRRVSFFSPSSTAESSPLATPRMHGSPLGGSVGGLGPPARSAIANRQGSIVSTGRCPERLRLATAPPWPPRAPRRPSHRFEVSFLPPGRRAAPPPSPTGTGSTVGSSRAASPSNGSQSGGAVPALTLSAEESLEPLYNAAGLTTQMLQNMTRRADAAGELPSDERRRAMLLDALWAQKELLIAENAELDVTNEVIRRHMQAGRDVVASS